MPSYPNNFGYLGDSHHNLEIICYSSGSTGRNANIGWVGFINSAGRARCAHFGFKAAASCRTPEGFASQKSCGEVI
jgi:hypothetical protein